MKIWKKFQVTALALSVATVVHAGTASQQTTAAIETKHTSKQVLYEVTLSVDGKITNSIHAVTNDGVPATISSTENTKYHSCASAADCTTKEVTTGLMISLTPRVAGNGSILTSANIDLSKLVGIATDPEDGYVNQKPVVDEVAADPTFGITSGKTLALPFDVQGRKYLVTIKAETV